MPFLHVVGRRPRWLPNPLVGAFVIDRQILVGIGMDETSVPWGGGSIVVPVGELKVRLSVTAFNWVFDANIAHITLTVAEGQDCWLAYSPRPIPILPGRIRILEGV